MRVRPRLLIALVLASAGATVAGFTLAQGSDPLPDSHTPIKHLVVIFDENESFDHYFGTYPNAANNNGTEPSFTAAPGTPAVDNYTAHPNLISNNPNLHPPARLARSQALTCDNNHNYADEQMAFHGGAMDQFVEHTAGGGCADKSMVMDYYDGNTVTGLWNLAQHFTMSDQHYETTFGPSTPGAINLISGNTHGAGPAQSGVSNGTDIGDPDPMGDDCAAGSMAMTGANIGDRMNTAHVTWGWFQGGFRPTGHAGGKAVCGAAHANIGGGVSADYSAHHEPFQYYASTANLQHLPPSSAAAIGSTDQANHQYDLTDFDTALKDGNLPQVSFLKPASFEDAHPGNSDPLDEQHFILRTLNALQQSPQWASTAVVITYDDSDGWYDHAYTPPTNPSNAAEDSLNGAGQCGVGAPADGFQARCGPGPRLPLLIVSPWVTPNTVSHTPIEQTSILKFIESNWSVAPIGGGSFDARATDLSGLFDFNTSHARAPVLILDPGTGQLVSPADGGGTPPATTPPVVAPPATTTPVVPPVVKPPKPTPKPKPKLTFTTKKSGKKLTVKLKVTGLSASKGKITLNAKLTLGKASIATGKGTVKSGRLTLTLKAKKALKRGTYKLAVTVTQAKKATKITKSFKLK